MSFLATRSQRNSAAPHHLYFSLNMDDHGIAFIVEQNHTPVGRDGSHLPTHPDDLDLDSMLDIELYMDDMSVDLEMAGMSAQDALDERENHCETDYPPGPSTAATIDGTIVYPFVKDTAPKALSPATNLLSALNATPAPPSTPPINQDTTATGNAQPSVPKTPHQKAYLGASANTRSPQLHSGLTPYKWSPLGANLSSPTGLPTTPLTTDMLFSEHGPHGRPPMTPALLPPGSPTLSCVLFRSVRPRSRRVLAE